MIFCHIFPFLVLSLAMPRSFQDLSPLIRAWTQGLAVTAPSANRWAARKLPPDSFFVWYFFFFFYCVLATFYGRTIEVLHGVVLHHGRALFWGEGLLLLGILSSSPCYFCIPLSSDTPCNLPGFILKRISLLSVCAASSLLCRLSLAAESGTPL